MHEKSTTDEPAASIPHTARRDTAPPMLASKFHLPRPHTQLVARPRLLTRLDAAWHKPLTLLAAPAGFGKTTLLAAWLNQPHQRARRIAWLALDAGDADPLQFLRYFIGALQILAPDVGATLLPLLHAAQPPSLQPLLLALLNDLQQLPDTSMIVLDDYHVVDNPTVHQALTYLLDHMPPRLHLVMTTRADPPLPLARLRARGQLLELRAADLRFTTDEATTLFHEVMGLPLSAGDVAEVEARTEGWIAGLYLAGLSLQERSTGEIASFIHSFGGSHRFVVDYLVDEVLAKQPLPIQNFLLHTSVLERLSAPLCAAVVAMEQGTCQQLLEQLERANLFIVPLDETRRWYRYHHLFAQVLLERLLRDAAQDELAALHTRAATWFEAQGDAAAAIHHWLAAHAWEHAAHLIETQGWLMILQGQRTLARGWLAALPAGILQTRPYLLELQAGIFFWEGDLEAAEQSLEAAERALGASESGETAPLVAYIAMMRGNIARARGDVARCVHFARQSIARLPAHDTIRRSVATLGVALEFLVTGDVRPANEQRVSAAVTSTQRAGNLPTLFNALLAQAELQRMQGHLHQAAASFEAARRVAPELLALRALNNGAGYHSGLGGILYEWNQIEASKAHLHQALAMIRDGLQTHADGVVSGYITQARLEQRDGEGDAARATLREVQALAHHHAFAPDLQVRIAAAQAALTLQQDDLPAARRWAEEHTWLLQGELTYPREHALLTLVRIRLAQSRHDPAALAALLSLLDQLQAKAEGLNRTDSVLHILMLRVLTLDAQGNTEAACASLQHALRLAMPAGYLRRVVDEGRPMARLLAQGINARAWQDDLHPYATRLLAVMQEEGMAWHADTMTPPNPAPVPLAGGETLTPRELEVLHLLAAGHSNQAIAQALVVEVGTVKRHVSNIMDKLQAQSRLEAVVRARNLKILPP